MGIKFKVKEYKDLPDDVYRAKLKNVEKKEGKHGDYLLFNFEVIDDEYAGTMINGLAGADVTIGNKTYKWIVALNGGKEFDVDSIGDLEDFKGATVKIVVVHKAEGDNNYARIESVLPDREKKSAAAGASNASKQQAAGAGTGKTDKSAGGADKEEDEFI